MVTHNSKRKGICHLSRAPRAQHLSLELGVGTGGADAEKRSPVLQILVFVRDKT